MRIKELEDALEAEREARMRVRSIKFVVNFFLCLVLNVFVYQPPVSLKEYQTISNHHVEP